jgi:cGMP-dependent protein kinase 1
MSKLFQEIVEGESPRLSVPRDYQPQHYISKILDSTSRTEALINEMIDLIAKFHETEEKREGSGGSRRNSLTMDTCKKHGRREQIFGEVNDSDVIATRVDVVLKSESSKYCILAVLKRHFLFSQLSVNEMEDVIDSMQNYFAAEGDTIITEGEKGDVFYILERGTCEVMIQGKVVQRLEDGSYFGDLALMYNCPRKASVVAVTDCALWTLDRMFFRRAMVTSSSNQNAQLAQFLSKISLFENLSEQTLNQVARSLSKQTFQDGDYIIRQNEIGDKFYVIVRGTVRVTVTGDSSDQESILNRLSEGETFGERALIKKEPRKANCIAEGECECYYLNSQDFALMLGEIVDKLNELDEFRILRSLSLFSRLNVSRLLQLKKSMVVQTIFYGQHIACEHSNIYIVLDGCMEGIRDKTKYGPRGTVGSLEVYADELCGSLTSITRESKVAILSRDALIVHIKQQQESLSSDDIQLKSRSVELEIEKSIRDESSDANETMNVLSNRRKSTAAKRRISTNYMACHRLEDLEIIRTLGKGTFGSVYLAMNKANRKLFALKCLDKEALVNSSQHHYVKREMIAMQSFSHPFIGSYIGVLLSPRKILFMLEYISGGELWNYVYRDREEEVSQSELKGLPVMQATLYAAMVMLALEHIHQHGYCFRDVKPENILITDRGYLKLVDFGFAKAVPFLNKNNRIQYRSFTLCGTAEYMAP